MKKTKKPIYRYTQQAMGINLSKFKMWVKKEFGSKCLKHFNWDCVVCRSNRLLEDLIAYVEFVETIGLPMNFKPR